MSNFSKPFMDYYNLGLNYRIPIPRPLPTLMDFINEQPHKDIEGLKQDVKAVLMNIKEKEQ